MIRSIERNGCTLPDDYYFDFSKRSCRPCVYVLRYEKSSIQTDNVILMSWEPLTLTRRIYPAALGGIVGTSYTFFPKKTLQFNEVRLSNFILQKLQPFPKTISQSR
jgi:hypothetical protein